jgi:tRNA/tmRNA/rRNA uracil-C5-methylase (TrmA/RlmC/RlmD family)
VARTTHLLHLLNSFIQVESVERYREFAIHAMKLIDERARHQDSFPHNHFTEAMYRAFDQMDEILGIRYELDAGMITSPSQTERLYEGAGAGVQTSYSSILLALDRANVAKDARILDLGSGYGRVGFVLGLLRPDIHFTGIEYVDHRVKDSREVAARAGLSRTEFLTEDLNTFIVPEADVYYMYDPFSRGTYGLVLEQLIDYGKTRPVTIITKGRANAWVREALQTHGWMIDETCDSGTVCLFRSLT